jgi:hypothetical protein
MKTILLAFLTTTCSAAEFRPEFIAIHSTEALTPASVKWTNAIYNIPGWRRPDGSVEYDVFKVGEVITLTNPAIETQGDKAHWNFTHDAIDVSAEMAAGRLKYTFTVKQSGLWSVAYAGAPAVAKEDVMELF